MESGSLLVQGILMVLRVISIIMTADLGSIMLCVQIIPRLLTKFQKSENYIDNMETSCNNMC